MILFQLHEADTHEWFYDKNFVETGVPFAKVF